LIGRQKVGVGKNLKEKGVQTLGKSCAQPNTNKLNRRVSAGVGKKKNLRMAAAGAVFHGEKKSEGE